MEECWRNGTDGSSEPSIINMDSAGRGYQYGACQGNAVQGVSFEVNSGESVGIVGRTGSGKSSLIVALFRLAEPHQGAIMLDGHNLLDLGLQVCHFSRVTACVMR